MDERIQQYKKHETRWRVAGGLSLLLSGTAPYIYHRLVGDIDFETANYFYIAGFCSFMFSHFYADRIRINRTYLETECKNLDKL